MTFGVYPGDYNNPTAAQLVGGGTASLGSDRHSVLHAAAMESATATHLYSRNYGLGLGIADATALGGIGLPGGVHGLFDDIGVDFVEAGIAKNNPHTLGTIAEISGGIWNGSPLGHKILAPVNSNGGDVAIIGQSAGATTLTVPDRGTIGGVKQGCMGSMQHFAAATRSSNTFTLPCTTPWFASAPTLGSAPNSGNPLCQVGDPIAVQVLDRGVLRWAHYTITANNVAGDYTQVQYSAFDPGNAVDGCIPPDGKVYFLGVLLNPLNFRNPHSIFLDKLSLESGSSTGTPLDGVAVRLSSGMFVARTVAYSGWWVYEMVNGGPFGGQGSQNTDHSESQAVWSAGAGYANRLYLTNSQNNGGANGRVTVGGGRDNAIRVDSGAPGFAHIVCADDGTMQTNTLMGSNFKSGAALIHGEGIAGVQCCEPDMIDCILGDFKCESPGNWVYYDASRTRRFWAFYDISHRQEAGISINGAGGATNFTDQPYHLTNVTIASSVLTGTITETKHGLIVGLGIQTGNGGPATTLLSSMNGLHFPQATIHCTSLTGFPTSGQALIDSSTGTQLVTYTGITGNDLTGCTGGKTNSIMATGGSVTSQVLAHETRIKTLDSTGQIITCDLVDYTGPDLSTPASCTLGTIGFMRAGEFTRYDAHIDWNVDGSDKYVDAVMAFDLCTLGPGLIRMTQNDGPGGSHGTLPTWRIRDAEAIGGTHATCTATGKKFASAETEFSQFDIGKTITCANVAAGADTIASFIDVNTVAMTGTVTNGSGLTWSMSDTQSLDDPRLEVKRGTDRYRVAYHSAADANAVVPGNLVELVTSSGGTLKVQRSTASKLRLMPGVAVTGNPAGGRVAVGNNGLTGSTGRVTWQGPALMLAMPETTLALGDNPTLITSTGTIAAGALLVDNGDGTVITPALTTGVPTAGQRVVGAAIKAAMGGFVAARLCAPYWT